MLNFNIFLHASAHMCSFRWMWHQATCCYLVCLFVCWWLTLRLSLFSVSTLLLSYIPDPSLLFLICSFLLPSIMCQIFSSHFNKCLCSIALHRQMASHRRFGPHLISSVDLSFVDLDLNSLNNEIIIILFYIYY